MLANQFIRVMGLYLNPNNENFRQDLKGSIYVDKSMLISELNKLTGTSDKFVCVSRPRRFGKSMAGNMISAYYSKGCDSESLFRNLKIYSDSSFHEYLNRINVIKIDLNGEYLVNKDKCLEILQEKLIKEFSQEFDYLDFSGCNHLVDCLMTAYGKAGEQFVIIIDEYDVLVRERAPKELFDDYLTFLNALFKNGTVAPAILLAYLTGILPIVRDKIQSKLNLLDEYSMTNAGQMAEFVGFTAEETKALCDSNGMDYDECRRWYDGYSLNSVKEIFSPKSVVTAMKNKEYGDYWTQTGSYEALKNYILMNFKDIRNDVVTMIGGGRVDVDILSYLNTMTGFHSKDDVFTYLIHLGYLAYDRKMKQCYIPNEEIRRQWVISVQLEEEYAPVMEMINSSRQLLEDTINGNSDAVADALDKAHTRATNPLTYNSESSFQSAIGLAYFYANTKYTVIKELPSGKGYADIALVPYVPNIPAIIIELKNGKSTGSALAQIKEKQYDSILQLYRGDMLLVGINYDPDTKEHQCRIESFRY